MNSQGDYRIFVGAFPTGEPAARIQAVREQYDRKTAAITPPHVTLWGTMWRTGLATAENEQETIAILKNIVPMIPAFELELGGIKTFNQRVVYLDVGLTEGLQAARAQLVQALGPDKHGRRFTPHLTLAMRLKRPQVQQMVADLRPAVWEQERFLAPIERLQLMQRAPHDPTWRMIASFPLGKVQ